MDADLLRGKIALVTGCKRGIGQAIARDLAKAGCDIIGVSASLDPQESQVGRDVEATGHSFTGYQCDFSDRKQLYEFIEKVKTNHPKVDILVNNAGTIKREQAEKHPDDYWDTVLAVNLTAPFILSREFGKEMLERGNGKIINIASLLSFQGGILIPGYAASKGGIKQLTMALSNEWAGRGVNVNAIAPGYIATDNTAALRADKNRNEAIQSRIPAGRWGKPEDISGTAVFLSSPAADYLNGTVITVDGGWMGR